MSRAGDLSTKLLTLLNAYPEVCHRAIVETFSEMLGEDWGDDEIKRILLAGVSASASAKDAIEVQLICYRIDYE